MRFLYIALALLVGTASNAQTSARDAKNDPEAKKVLDAVSTKFKTYKTVQAGFTYKVENASGKSLSSKSGTILMKGTKYKVSFGGNEIYSDGKLSPDKKTLEIFFEAKTNIFGENTAGVPFLAYAVNNFKQQDMAVTSYAVLPGDSIKDSWNVQDFPNGNYHIAVHGPNGFLREFIGNDNDLGINISCTYQHAITDTKKLTGNIEINLQNEGNTNTIEITDHYTKTSQTKSLDASASSSVVLDLNKTYGWYDFTLKVKDNKSFEKRYAGRIETGKESFTDPIMGGVMV